MSKPIDIYEQWNLSDRKCNTNYNIIYGYYMQELTNKVTSIFEFDGLPETVNQNYFKMLLALTGNCSITKFDDWYAVKGQRGGTPNAYYIPENYIIANPKLGSKTIPLTDKDITVFYMTPFDECTNIGSGLYGLLNRTADSLTHVDISINTALKNSRVVALFETVSDTQQKRVDGILKKMREGEDVFAIKAPFDGELKINPFLSGANIPEIIRELIELKQFIIANFYHSIGINSNYNLKRAQISTTEIETNDDILIVNTYEMKSQLEKGCEEFNSKTAMNISVRYSEPWQKLKEMEEEQTEVKEGEENGENDTTADDNNDKSSNN